ncbi:conserved hypothetical protein [Desulfamplus magnetovallimortis]|uniref:Uncharacterized protein n=1 Tax=Desulfamplus magnetovallimortis TaxID=1246637 RepID=A0A1W1HEL7_9BACT|nr:hypothetical protein [Desulfamplus magnetovallimortis]SLM30951.1 conserved hypothetical protein [Desulfamplus magnetovallimortis]
MSGSIWQQQGATLSHKNACKEYGLTEQQIIDAIRNGKLQYKQNYAHGNPYYRVLRKEVESLAQDILGKDGIKEQAVKHELASINREINSLKRKLSTLEKKKKALLEKHEIKK